MLLQPCKPPRSPFTACGMQALYSSPGYVQINRQHDRQVMRQHHGACARQPQRTHCDSSAGNASGGGKSRSMACTAEGSDADSREAANRRQPAGPVAETAAGVKVNSAAGWPTRRRTCLVSAAAAVAALALPSPTDAALTLERPQLFEQVGSAVAALLPDTALNLVVKTAAGHHRMRSLCLK